MRATFYFTLLCYIIYPYPLQQHTASLSLQIILGIIMGINTSIWFMVVGSILTIPRIQQQFIKVIPYTTVALSCLMVGLGIWIIIQQF